MDLLKMSKVFRVRQYYGYDTMSCMSINGDIISIKEVEKVIRNMGYIVCYEAEDDKNIEVTIGPSKEGCYFLGEDDGKGYNYAFNMSFSSMCVNLEEDELESIYLAIHTDLVARRLEENTRPLETSYAPPKRRL